MQFIGSGYLMNLLLNNLNDSPNDTSTSNIDEITNLGDWCDENFFIKEARVYWERSLIGGTVKNAEFWANEWFKRSLDTRNGGCKRIAANACAAVAREHSRKGEHIKAIERAKQSLKWNPTAAIAHKVLCESSWMLGKVEHAKKYY